MVKATNSALKSFHLGFPFGGQVCYNKKRGNTMSEEQKKNVSGPLADRDRKNDEILKEYTQSFWHNSKFWLGLVVFFFVLLFALIYKKTVVDTTLNPKQLKATLEFFDISSQWVVNERVSDEDFQGIILVPEVSFRVRNLGRKALSYVFLLAVFRFMDSGKYIGEGYQMTLRRPLPPGGESDRITLKAGFGYRATSAAAFEKYKENWRNSFCEVFAKSHNSGLTWVKTFYVSRKIAGQDIEIKIK